MSQEFADECLCGPPGLVQTVIARDSWPVPQPGKRDSLNVASGVWAFRYPVLTHANRLTG